MKSFSYLFLPLIFFCINVNAQQPDDCGIPPIENLCLFYGEIPSDFTITTPIYTSSFLGNDFTGKTFHINSVLYVNSYFELTNCILKFGAQGRIEVVTNGQFISNKSEYFGCNGWSGIKITSNSYVDFSGNSIQDADKAISIGSSSAIVSIQKNNFSFNKVGISVINVSTGAYIGGNTFIGFISQNLSLPLFNSIGIQATKASLSIGTQNINSAADINFFANLKFGIQAHKAYVSSYGSDYRCHMENAIQSNLGKISVNKSVDIQSGADIESLFYDNLRDIESNGSIMNVSRSNFYEASFHNIRSVNNGLGQKIDILDNDIDVSGDPYPKVSVYVERSYGANNGGANNQILRNNMTIKRYGNTSRRGIYVKSFGTSIDRMDVLSNVINMNAGGSYEGSQYSSGFELHIGPAIQYKYRYNSIFPTNSPPPNDNRNRWGFFLRSWSSPSFNNHLTQNHVVGLESSFDHGMCAFHFTFAGPWNICKNDATQTQRGFHINGNCSTSSFSHNEMGIHHSISGQSIGFTAALLMDANSSLGDQFCKFNTWEELDYGPDDSGAWHKGPNYTQSEFHVDFSQSGFFPNPIRTTDPLANWIRPFACTTSPFDCTDDTFELELDEIDEGLIAENQNYVEPISAIDWEEKKSILIKLLEKPSLLVNNPNATTFFNSHINERVGQFATYEKELYDSQLFTIEEDDINNGFQDDIQAKIESLDNLIPNTDDLQGFLLARKNSIEGLELLIHDYNLFIDDIQHSRSVVLNVFIESLNDLEAYTQVELNQKELYRILIKKYLGESFSTLDILSLEDIADQCSQLAGNTNQGAMGFLPEGNQHINYYENGNPSCNQERESNTKDVDLLDNVSVNPNPTKGMLYLNGVDDSLQYLEVISTTGKVILSIKNLPPSSPIDVNKLAAGFYFVKITTNKGIKTLPFTKL